MTDWAAVRDAYGPALEIPGLLAALTSAADRQPAIDELWSRLCHQETVYTASAAAVPALFEAARTAPLSRRERASVLALIACIGRVDGLPPDPPETALAGCPAAVAEIVPDVVRWADASDDVAQAAALLLGMHHPRRFLAAGVPAASLLQGDQPPPVRAGALLARAAVAGVELSESDVRAAAATDADVLDYLEQALAGDPVDQQARSVARELLDRVAYGE